MTREQFDQVLCYIEEDFAFWHSCLSERKHPTLTSYSLISQLPPSDFVPFCRMNRYMERLSLPHTQPFTAARQIACRIRTYGITLVRLHAFPFLPHNACRLRLPRKWNSSFSLSLDMCPLSTSVGIMITAVSFILMSHRYHSYVNLRRSVTSSMVFVVYIFYIQLIHRYPTKRKQRTGGSRGGVAGVATSPH